MMMILNMIYLVSIYLYSVGMNVDLDIEHMNAKWGNRTVPSRQHDKFLHSDIILSNTETPSSFRRHGPFRTWAIASGVHHSPRSVADLLQRAPPDSLRSSSHIMRPTKSRPTSPPTTSGVSMQSVLYSMHMSRSTNTLRFDGRHLRGGSLYGSFSSSRSSRAIYLRVLFGRTYNTETLNLNIIS